MKREAIDPPRALGPVPLAKATKHEPSLSTVAAKAEPPSPRNSRRGPARARSGRRGADTKENEEEEEQVAPSPSASKGSGMGAGGKKKKKKGGTPKKGDTLLGPFPDHAGPLPGEVPAVLVGLVDLHGRPQRKEAAPPGAGESEEEAAAAGGGGVEGPRTVLDSLVRTILSQNTTDVTSLRAFLKLKASFPTWESVLDAAPGDAEDAVREGGLADIKIARVRVILATLVEERGEMSLEYMRGMSTEDAKKEICRFKGVGPKTASCVVMFAMGRADFPVDTHVWRISRRLGWVPQAAGREDTYEHLNRRIPDEVKYDLHVLLVKHGKVCPDCAKGGGRSGLEKVAGGACPITAVLRARKGGQKAAEGGAEEGGGAVRGVKKEEQP